MSEACAPEATSSAYLHNVPDLVKALVQVHLVLQNPEANRRADVRSDKGNYHYEYADLDEVYTKVRKTCAEHGIVITHDVKVEGGRVAVTTELLHVSGQALVTTLSQSCTGPIQTMGGVITYLKRYGISARLALAVDRDDDANGASGNAASIAPKPRGTFKASGTPPESPRPAEPPATSAPAPTDQLDPRARLLRSMVGLAREFGATVSRQKDVGAVERALFGQPASSLPDAKVAELAAKFGAPTEPLRTWVRERLTTAELIGVNHE